jgi:predicted phosphodiesterase
MKSIKKKTVLVISDTHFPFEHPQTYEFLNKLKNKYRPDEVVHIGDVIDQYCFTRWVKNPDMDSAKEEVKKVRQSVQKLAKLFPKMKVITGNHDVRLYKRASEVAIPEWALKDLKEIYGFPSGWTLSDSFVIDGVKYVHGEGLSSGTAALKRHHQSVVYGHTHQAGITIDATDQELMFSLNIGCLIDIDKYAFEYATGPSNRRPFIGTGVVSEGFPYLETMDLGTKVKRAN